MPRRSSIWQHSSMTNLVENGTVVRVMRGICFFDRADGGRYYPARGTKVRVFRVSENGKLFWLETLDERYETCGMKRDLKTMSALEQLALQSDDSV